MANSFHQNCQRLRAWDGGIYILYYHPYRTRKGSLRKWHFL